MDSKGFVTINSSAVLGQWDISFGLVTSYARRPLRFTGTGTFGGQTNTFSVDTLIRPSLQAAVGFLSLPHIGAELGIIVPMGITAGRSSPNDADGNEWTFANQGLGDIQIHPKLRLLNATRRGLGFAIIPSVILGTGDKNSFIGEGQTIFQPTAVLDTELGYLGRFRAAVNAGMRIRPSASTYVNNPGSFTTAPTYNGADLTTGGSIEVKNEVIGGIGLSYGIVPQKFDLVAELYGNYGLDSHRTDNAGAARETMKPSAEAIGAIKLYLARNSFFELGGGYKVSSGYGSAAPRAFVGFIFEPSIGDRDGDGYKDDVDQCPDDPEDFDDFEDEDGCPEPDNDKDGILDDVDKCPNEPETKNGIADEDGCPDTIPPGVVEALATANKAKFDPNSVRISSRIKASLDKALLIMMSNPKLKFVITVHPDKEGDKFTDVARRRGENLKGYLIEQGVAMQSITAAVGPPVADAKAPMVEITIAP